jgi:hypothetical protein
MAVAGDTPGLTLLHPDPPVVLVEGFMSSQQCDEWMAAAEESGGGRLGEGSGASSDWDTGRVCCRDMAGEKGRGWSAIQPVVCCE